MSPVARLAVAAATSRVTTSRDEKVVDARTGARPREEVAGVLAGLGTLPVRPDTPFALRPLTARPGSGPRIGIGSGDVSVPVRVAGVAVTRQVAKAEARGPPRLAPAGRAVAVAGPRPVTGPETVLACRRHSPGSASSLPAAAPGPARAPKAGEVRTPLDAVEDVPPLTGGRPGALCSAHVALVAPRPAPERRGVEVVQQALVLRSALAVGRSQVVSRDARSPRALVVGPSHGPETRAGPRAGPGLAVA